MSNHEKSIVNEFCHLLEKSKQLFSGLSNMKISAEYCLGAAKLKYLFPKQIENRSKFSKDLPQHGHKQWQTYFGRTFDIYTKLWKFQQQHRGTLDHLYGLRRWQIGEIASKIGQLYYHYYLRTSDINYLYDSFSFYLAIRSRSYYSDAAKEDRPDLMVKKLRYYARFIVVCLLLKKISLVRELAMELESDIHEYTQLYQPSDQAEWRLVLEEIHAFINADCPLQVFDSDTKIPVQLQHRLTPAGVPPLDRGFSVCLNLTEVVIVGSCYDQVKFSELTLDMFRMLQTLERAPIHPQADPHIRQVSQPHYSGYSRSNTSVANPSVGGPSSVRRAPGLHEAGRQISGSSIDNGPIISNPLNYQQQYGSSSNFYNQHRTSMPVPGRGGQHSTSSHHVLNQTHSAPGPTNMNSDNAHGSAGSGRELPNPHKYLLYKPSFSQFNTFLATSYRELPAFGALLIYISGDGAPSRSAPRPGECGGYLNGGIATSNRRETDMILRNRRALHVKDSHCIHPGDLYPYVRKPLFVIIDSDNSFAFKDLSNLFGQPLVCFMSPEEVPSSILDQHQRGNLFTLFLHCPISAVCSICNIHSLSTAAWDRAYVLVERFLTETARVLMRSQHLDHSYLQFYGDDFLRLLILRYCFCCVALRLHRSFRAPRHYPQCQPALPTEEVFEQATLHRLVFELAALLDVRQCFAPVQHSENYPREC